MYHTNVACTPPDNDSTKVWRYMTFTKFMSLVDRSALYFARVDRLGDPFEGSFTTKYFLAICAPKRWCSPTKA